jgi:hypothetical protein
MAELTRAACGCELASLPGFCPVHGEWQTEAWTEPPPVEPPSVEAAPAGRADAAARASGDVALLVTHDGQSVEIPQGREVLLGRESDSAAVRSLLRHRDAVSRRHAYVLVAAGRVRLRDIGSSNGTWVRGERVTRPVELSLPAEFGLGRELTVTIRTAPP